MRINGDMYRALEISSSRKNKQFNKIGLFHGFTEELKLSLLINTMEDAPATKKDYQVYLSKHIASNVLRKIWKNSTAWKIQHRVSLIQCITTACISLLYDAGHTMMFKMV